MGVWIETLEIFAKRQTHLVTPFVGVWIETAAVAEAPLPTLVTPFVGVWIETRFDSLAFGGW